ncbi:MAG: hypothetical protein AAF961_08665, partial [Planctomycetota bacterium]
MPHPRQVTGFLARFDEIRVRHRRATLVRTGLSVLLTALVLFVGLASLDYFFELSQGVRAAAALATGAGLALAAALLVRRAIRQASETQLAAALECEFPELGQAVRTSLQFRDPKETTDASPELVSAMHRDVDDRATGLPLDHIVPIERVQRVGLAFALGLTVMAVAATVSWQWRTASLRTLLGRQAYTHVAVTPMAEIVDEGAALQLTATVSGRTNRPTSVWYRQTGSDGTNWNRQDLTDRHVVNKTGQEAVYDVEIPNVRDPIEYRVASGAYTSAIHLADVLRPLRLESVEVRITAPIHTDSPERVVSQANFKAIAGSTALLQFTLDRPAVLAHLEFTSSAADAAKPIPCKLNGRTILAQLDLTHNATYSIVASAKDGGRLKKNRYQIRVRNDKAPRVWFED